MTRADIKKVSPDTIARMLGTTGTTVRRTLYNHIDGNIRRKTVLASKIIEIAERVVGSYELDKTA